MATHLCKLLIAVLCIALLFGCTNQAPPPDTTAPAKTDSGQVDPTEYEWDYQIDTSPTVIHVWWPSVWSWAKTAVENGWTDNVVYQHITQKTGVTLDIEVPVGTESELAGSLIASGDLPEVMVFDSYTSPYITQMAEAEMIYDWNELMAQYAPKMPDLIYDTQWVYHTDDQGRLWKYVGFEYNDKTFEAYDRLGVPPTHEDNVMYARKDTLAAFGAEDITTLDDYTAYLHFVKQDFPDLDPVRLFVDTPRSNLFAHMRSTFGVHLSGTYPQQDGTLKHYMYDPAYVDYLAWLNGLFRDGVISASMLTYDQAAMDTKYYSALYASFKGASYEVFNTLEQTIIDNYGDDDNYQYKDIGPIAKEGIPWYTNNVRTKGAQCTVITKNTTQPDRIIRFFEYLLTEDGQITINCGVEGESFTYDGEGNRVFTDEVKALASQDLELYTATYCVNGNWSPWCDAFYWEDNLGALITPAEGIEKEVNLKRLSSIKDIWMEGFIEITGVIQGGSDLDVLNTKVEDVCTSAAMKMIVATSDEQFKQLYDTCLAEIERLGVAQVEAAYTQEYHRNRELLDLE